MLFDYKKYDITTKPGCYLYKDSEGRIIYVGKAKNLKKRVASYFTKRNHDNKTKVLVKKITDMEYIVTDNEVEALLLEARLIRKHQPKFNINLKHSERYAYIKITAEKFPRVITSRLRTKDGTYFGPFTDGSQRVALVRLANRLFKLRTCKRMPKTVCLNYHIKLCDGPCEEKITIADYQDRIKKVKLLLKGKTHELIKELESEMKDYSRKQLFEQAKDIRDQIFALQRRQEQQKVSLTKKFNQDVINFIEKDKKIFIQMFNITKGIISNRKSFKIAATDSLDDFIKQYYYFNDIPQEIIIPQTLRDQEVITKYLSKLRKTNVTITIPQKGTKKQLIDLVLTNLKQDITEEEQILVDVQQWLNIPTVPTRIECFDISNLRDQFAVGSMVHFFNGKPDKSNYRRFKIRTVTGQDDFLMMAEIIRRRYTRLLKERATLPDLIIIDGGKGQLNAALAVLEKLNLKIPIVGLAKKFEEVYQPHIESPKRLSLRDPRIKLFQRIRDEAHRFAITYHRLLREKIK